MKNCFIFAICVFTYSANFISTDGMDFLHANSSVVFKEGFLLKQGGAKGGNKSWYVSGLVVDITL